AFDGQEAAAVGRMGQPHGLPHSRSMPGYSPSKGRPPMEFITCDRDGHVLLIGLNRPKKYNAMNRAMYRELADAYGLLEQDADLRCALVFAHGEHFTAGLQLDEWAEVFGSGEP